MILTKEQIEEIRTTNIWPTDQTIDLLDTIADLERQRDTAHAAVIQAVAHQIECHESTMFGAWVRSPKETTANILALTSTEVERLKGDK